MIENLTEEDILSLKTNSYFLICKTNSPNIQKDKLTNFRNFCKEQGFTSTDIPDGFKIDRKAIEHIFDAHWYDTEIWVGTSIRPHHITFLLDILENYDEAKVYDSTRLRFLLRKTYNWSDYWIVVEIDHTNPKIPNQLKLITMYINDFCWSWAYEILKKQGPNAVEKARKANKKLRGDRFLPDNQIRK